MNSMTFSGICIIVSSLEKIVAFLLDNEMFKQALLFVRC